MIYKLPFETVKRKTIIKKESETNSNYCSIPEQLSTEQLIRYSIVNIDKPPGPTSHQVSDYTQRILNIQKSGHSGTLDPKVTGCLPIALGDATRIVQVLLTAGKEYVALMHLHKELNEKTIKKSLKNFVGTIKQLPPIKSSVRRVERERDIYYIEFLEMQDKDVLFRIGCEAGTYIRKFCLHPQTEILTKKGFFLAEDFYCNPQNIFTISKNKMIEKNPSAIQKLPSPIKLIKITMSSGINIAVTPDHELLVSKNEGYKMCEAKSLNKGDYMVKCVFLPETSNELIVSDLLDDSFYIQQEDIRDKCKKAFISEYGSIRAMYRKLKLDRKAFLSKSDNAITIKHLKLAGIYEKIKRNIHTFKTQKGKIIKLKKMNEDLFYLLGLIASDGNNTKEKGTVRYTRIKFHNENEVLVNRFLDIYKKLFPKVLISKRKVTSNLFQLDTTNSFLATIAASLGIKSPQKNSDLLPILNSSINLIKSFLRGYFDGDGSVSYWQKNRPPKYKTRICLHTISYRDATRLHKMLLKVGIPNKIFKRKAFYKNEYTIYEATIGNIAAQKKFIREVGTNHPKKKKVFEKIMKLIGHQIYDNYYIGLHYKKYIRQNKSKLHKIGGNLNRILKSKIPITKGFYRKVSKLVKLPKLSNFIIEKITKIEKITFKGNVYDMTVPKTHNFLIETGYISSNCHDFGAKLKIGAHMSELRRTKAGPFNESTLVTLHDLSDAYWYYKHEDNDTLLRKALQPIENAVVHLPKIWVIDSCVNSLCNGAALAIPGISKLESGIKEFDLVAVLTLKNELICLGNALLPTEEILKKEKGFAVKTSKVFMKPNIYPKI